MTDHDMHGGYGRCGGLGKVWVDDGEASNFYAGGSCPDCVATAAKLAKVARAGAVLVDLPEKIEACIADIKAGLCCPRIHGCEQNDGEYCLVRQAFARSGLIPDPYAEVGE